jgi:hypothetical protein
VVCPVCGVPICDSCITPSMPAGLSRANRQHRKTQQTYEARHDQASPETPTPDTDLDLPALRERSHSSNSQTTGFQHAPVPKLQTSVCFRSRPENSLTTYAAR